MAVLILFPVHKLMNMGTPRKDFFMSGPSGTLSGPEWASYSSKSYHIKTANSSQKSNGGLN